MIGDFGVAGGDHYAVDTPGLAERGQRLPIEHASQRFPMLDGQKSRQALLGILRVFDRQDSEDQAGISGSIPSSRTTTRASDFLSRSPRMMVLVTTGRMAHASTWAACLRSTSSSTNMPAKSR